MTQTNENEGGASTILGASGNAGMTLYDQYEDDVDLRL